MSSDSLQSTLSERVKFGRLITDIQIVGDRDFDPDTLASKLTINTGNDRLEPTAKIAANYVGESFIPRLTWRHLNSAERQLLISPICQWVRGYNIGILKIPDRELELLRQTLIIADRQVTIEHNDLHQAAIRHIANYLQAYTVPQEPIKSLGINTSQPGLITTTRDEIKYLPDKPYVGLHLDSWEKAPLKRRHLSSNRLCINVGRETRYFLFINLSLLRMFEMLGLRDPQDIPQYYRGIGLPDLFLHTYPDYPVLKLALAPNEAYIAPTENIIHDASSIDKHKIDLSLTFLGKFFL